MKVKKAILPIIGIYSVIMRLRTEKADGGMIRKAYYGKLFLYDGVPRSYFTFQPNELSIEEKQH